MTKIITTVILSLVCTAFGALPLFAQTGNGAPSGTHYNLNIIGVENPKKAKLDLSNRHTIFVPLNQDLGTHSDIWLTQGDFKVCDGNAFVGSPAFNCAGTQIKPEGAVFQLPCNTNVTADVTCDLSRTSLAYEVWVRELGTPGGTASITLCATDPDPTFGTVCNMDPNVVMLSRNSGSKPTFRNVTDELTVLHKTSLGNVALFTNGFEDWVWQYSNQGLRLAQLRFYQVD